MKYTVTVVKSVDLVTEFEVEAEDETEAERLAEDHVDKDDRNVPGFSLQWDDEGSYGLDVSEVVAVDGNVI